MEICDIKKCTGCFACLSVCAHNAIYVGTDLTGKTIPMTDSFKCVQCGACIKVCPVNHKVDLTMPLHAIAAWSKNREDIEESSSGGAAAVFSRKVLRENGVVYGASFMSGVVKHVRVNNEESIKILRGSKYVQSYTGNIYRKVKNDLISGKTVLFTGVPCQIAGLKSYLNKEYSNLITVDLICHGTPPMQYLKEHINKLVSIKWDSVSFRGLRDWFLTVYAENKVLYTKHSECDLYFKAFLEQLSYRDNCYQCSYAQPKRCADITIGDFWGVDRDAMKNKYDGRISLVLINSKKGEDFWDLCAENFVWEERTLNEAMNPKQENLLHPSIPHEERLEFIKNFQAIGFEKAVTKTQLGKKVRLNQIKETIKKSFIMKILRALKQKIL